MVKVAEEGAGEEAGEMRRTLDELAREGARRMLVAALEAEVAAYVEAHRGTRDEVGHAQVVRNGRGRVRRPPPMAAARE